MTRHDVNQVGYEALADAIVNRAIQDAKSPPFLSYKDICFAESGHCPYMYKNDCFRTNKQGRKYFAVQGSNDPFHSCVLKEHLLNRELMEFFESEWFKILLHGRDVEKFLQYHHIYI